MKLMIASDIHGSALYCEQMLEAYRQIIIIRRHSLSRTEK